jgi:hypothetical protein
MRIPFAKKQRNAFTEARLLRNPSASVESRTRLGSAADLPSYSDVFVTKCHADREESRLGEQRRWINILAQAGPDLVYDYDHHEQEIDSKRPHHELLRPFQLAAGNQVLFQSRELLWFERRQNQLLIGGSD